MAENFLGLKLVVLVRLEVLWEAMGGDQKEERRRGVRGKGQFVPGVGFGSFRSRSFHGS